MTIAIGDQIPDVTVSVMKDGSPTDVSARELLGTGRVVLFAVPGAFTPGCSRVHLPGYAEHAAEIAGKGRLAVMPTGLAQGGILTFTGSF